MLAQEIDHVEFILPPDIVIVPVDKLAPGLRRQIQHEPGDYAISRPRMRRPSKVVGPTTAGLLQEFRQPATILDADVCRHALRGGARLALVPAGLLDAEMCRAIGAAFAQNNVDGPTVFQSDRDEWILRMAAAGLGYALMPAQSAPHPGVAALRLLEPEITREIALVTPRGRPHAPAVRALVHEVTRMRWTSVSSPAVAADSPALAEASAR